MNNIKVFGEDRLLAGFLYILARDHLTLGQIERIMQDHISKLEEGVVFTSDVLGQYAVELTARLRGKT